MTVTWFFLLENIEVSFKPLCTEVPIIAVLRKFSGYLQVPAFFDPKTFFF